MKEAVMAEKGQKKTFYDHYSRDRMTKVGGRLTKCVSNLLFEFAQITPSCSVLEIGPGRGVFADICLDNDVDYWAIEPNEKMADDIERRGANVIRCIVPSLPEMDRTFDVVMMSHVMEHMDTMTAALNLSREVYQVLKPGGKFVICVPDYVSWKHHFFQGDFSHNYVTTLRRIEGLLISAGFENVESGYHCGPFKGAMCFLISALAAWLPFGCFSTMFPRSKWLYKLYKLQIYFLRRVLILGKRQA
jgi:SAM-dependent methyltransferase